MLKLNFKDSKLCFKYETELFIEVLKLYEKTFATIKTSEIYSLLPTLLMIVEIYHGSLISIHPNRSIVSSLLKIVENLQRPELNEMHSLLNDCEYEGVSPIT